VWSGFVWLRIRTAGGLLWTFGFWRHGVGCCPLEHYLHQKEKADSSTISALSLSLTQAEYHNLSKQAYSTRRGERVNGGHLRELQGIMKSSQHGKLLLYIHGHLVWKARFLSIKHEVRSVLGNMWCDNWRSIFVQCFPHQGVVTSLFELQDVVEEGQWMNKMCFTSK
jgi:hypothetical protein